MRILLDRYNRAFNLKCILFKADATVLHKLHAIMAALSNELSAIYNVVYLIL